MIDALLFLLVLFSPFLLAFFTVLVCMILGIEPTAESNFKRNKNRKKMKMKGVEYEN